MATTDYAGTPEETPRLFGHPTGLFTLFFAEMWERFSYYGMRALLIFYITKGFLGYNDEQSYAVYGAYTALVYATPFIGGMLADKILGSRKAVVLGGILMAAGHFVMTIESTVPFFIALALLIVGNGFFKPNISTIVGGLYPEGDEKRDAGFTLFYMGINLGAAIAPLLCGYVGETYGWHYGFGLATAGMLVGLAVFVAPTIITQILIFAASVGTAIGMLWVPDNVYTQTVMGVVALFLLAAAGIAIMALQRGGLPEEAGQPKDPEAINRTVFGIPAGMAIYGGTALAVPAIAAMVYFHSVASVVLSVLGIVAMGYLVKEALASNRIERDRMFVVFVLMFFSMLFWAFFEQAGSSITMFTDRNVDRVFESEEQVVTDDMVGTEVEMLVQSSHLGKTYGDEVINLTVLDGARALARSKSSDEEMSPGDTRAVESAQALAPQFMAAVDEAEVIRGAPVIDWPVEEDDVGLTIEGSEVPASIFQSANAIFILMFGLVFSGLWGFLGARGKDPSAPVKFSLGLLQLGLGFVALWFGAQNANGMGMVGVSWLLLGYLLHTTGELCLSPVGLSMVTKLAPARLVSTVMGAWFLATAFSNLLASFIAMFTSVGHGEGGEASIPVPLETVNIYGDVFGQIGLVAIASSLVLFLMSGKLTKMMHMSHEELAAGGAGH